MIESPPSSKAATRAATRPWYSRLAYALATLLGLGAILVGFVQLLRPTLAVQTERVQLGDIPVTILSSGEQPAPAVVVAHGFAGSQQIMAPFAMTLARNGYTVFTFDFPGHGQNVTPLRGDITDGEGRYAQLRAALDEVVGLARQRSDGRVGLLGHSMGSEAVVRYAQTNPEIAATVGVSLVYEGTTPTSPRNLLVLTGALEYGLRPIGQRVADATAGGTGQGALNTTYGSISAGTARRVVFVPYVEHIAVLFSPVALDEALRWFDASFARERSATPLIDDRMLWLGVLYLGAIVLFWPFALLFDLRVSPPSRAARAPGWWLVAVLPALLTPIALRFVPTDDLLPILVGGPLALHFALYGVLTGVGLIILVWRVARRTAASPGPVRPSPTAPPSPTDRRMSWLAVFRRRFLVYTALALLVTGYSFLVFGLPTQLFVLNYFPPPERLSVFAAICVAMLPYFLADEWLTRRAGGPRGAYPITKVIFVLSLVLAIALNPRLFFLVIIAPLFGAYFVIYGLFSGVIFKRTGTTIIGAVANAVIFAWVIAAAFPLVA